MTHFCETCKQPVAHCDQPPEACTCQGSFHCSAHHPDPEFKVEDKPAVRMTVAVAKD